MAQIRCENLTLGYEGRNVIENLNFEVNAGDYLCVVGENGAGKSTLMKALLGLKQPTSGKVQFGDGLTPNGIGYLPQQTQVQKDFPATVEEIVRTGVLSRASRFMPFYTAKERAYAERQMERMGITGFRKRCYRELSGGQQQRVLLARALCAAEKMILLDEPVAGLDPKVTQEMYDLIAQLNVEGVTVIMVSHDISAAVLYASHILHISPINLFFGTKQQYLQTEIGRVFTGNQPDPNNAEQGGGDHRA